MFLMFTSTFTQVASVGTVGRIRTCGLRENTPTMNHPSPTVNGAVQLPKQKSVHGRLT